MSTIFPNSKGDNIPEDDKDDFRGNLGLGTAAVADASDFVAVGSIDPRTIPGMIAGYNIANTIRTGSLVDSWLDISGNGRTAVFSGTKSTIAGTGDDEYAYLGDPYNVSTGIPVTPEGMTIVAIYKGGRIPYQYRGEFSTLALPSDTGIGMLYFSGAAQFYSTTATNVAGVAFEGARGNCMAQRFGAEERSHTINGLTWTVSGNPAATNPFTQIWGGFTGAFTWQYERVALYFYNRTLSDYEIAGIQAYHDVPTATSAFFPVADSFGVGYTAGTTDQGYARLVEAATGSTLVGLATKQATTTAQVISENQAGITYAIGQLIGKGIVPVVLFDVGKNDIANNVSVSTLESNYETLIEGWTTAGAQVIATTLPPRNTGFAGTDASTYESRRLEFNTWLRAQSSLWTGLADVAADGRIGDVADLAGPNYSDGIHPTAAGHAIYAEIILAAINSLP